MVKGGKILIKSVCNDQRKGPNEEIDREIEPVFYLQSPEWY